MPSSRWVNIFCVLLYSASLVCYLKCVDCKNSYFRAFFSETESFEILFLEIYLENKCLECCLNFVLVSYKGFPIFRDPLPLYLNKYHWWMHPNRANYPHSFCRRTYLSITTLLTLLYLRDFYFNISFMISQRQPKELNQAILIFNPTLETKLGLLLPACPFKAIFPSKTIVWENHWVSSFKRLQGTIHK